MKPVFGKISPKILERIVYRHLGAERDDVILGPSIGEDAAIVKMNNLKLAASCDPISGAINRLGWLAVNIAANDIANDTTPIFTAETIEIKGVPVSFRQYLDIKANPHGLVRYTCGSAGAGWIKELKYKIVDGTADFILLKSLRN